MGKEGLKVRGIYLQTAHHFPGSGCDAWSIYGWKRFIDLMEQEGFNRLDIALWPLNHRDVTSGLWDYYRYRQGLGPLPPSSLCNVYYEKDIETIKPEVWNRVKLIRDSTF